MIRVVFDANVLVSGIPASSRTIAHLIDHRRSGKIQLVVSQHIIDEVDLAWTKPYWRTRFSQTQVERALDLLQNETEVTPITAQVSGVARRPEADLILATAVSAQVEFLITGDKRLQALGDYRGVAIVSPRESLEALMRRDEGDIGSD